MAWDLSCKDWEARLRNGRSLVPDLSLNKDEADRAVAIFNKLRLPDVPGTPAFESAAGDWFRDIVRAVFGSYDVVTSHRLVREIFLLIPKKNSKTTNGAGLMMTATVMNRRPRADFLFAGPTQAISDLAFSQAVGMIEADDEHQRQENGKEGFLKRSMRVQEHIKRIIYYGPNRRPRTKINDTNFLAQLVIKTFSEDILTGRRPVGIMLDEIHLLGKDASALRVIGQLRGGMISNPEAFLAMFTTQSDEPPAGAFLAELTRARMVRDGEIKGDLLAILYEFPEAMIRSDAWRDPANWPMVNPNNGRSITIERLIQDRDTAEIAGDGEFKRWASQHLNIPIGVYLGSTSWKGAKYWEKNAEPMLAVPNEVLSKADLRIRELDDMLARCEVAVIGADGGGLDDLYGLVVLGRERRDEDDVDKRIWHCWAHAWCFRSVLEERKDIAPRLLDFEKDGDLTFVDDPGDDLREIADIIERVRDVGLLPDKGAVGVDTFGLAELVDALAARGFDVGDEAGWLRGVPQGWQLKTAINTAERRLKGGRLKHNGSPMMNWVMGNARVEPRGNSISITKQVSGTAKIDPLMALLNTVALMARNPEVGGSVYTKDRGLLIFDVA
jgi:phage terminase large subunit-like protein